MRSILVSAFFSQLLITFMIWARLLYFRITTHTRRKIHPQKVADEEQAKIIYKDGVNLSDNFENQFEMPVLFYAIVLFLLVQNHIGIWECIFAWGFVFFRAAHAFIHTTTNWVLHRFYAFTFASVCLWLLVLISAVQFVLQT